MAKIDPNVITNIQNTDVSKLIRDDLGVHFSFSPANETLKQMQSFLLDIANKASDKLTNIDVQNFQNRGNAFVNLAEQITKFSPKTQNVQNRDSIIQQIENEWQQTKQDLRTVHNSLKLESLDVGTYQNDIEGLLNRLSRTRDQADKLLNDLKNLPTQTDSKYNDLFKDIQGKLDQEFVRIRKDLDAYTTKYENDLKARDTETVNLSANFKKRLKELSDEVEQKIAEVQQQARKFSAKEALATYSQIFENEALLVNKPAIRRWEITLFLLVVTEIAAALSLFFYFLPEVISIANNWGEQAFGTGLIISILFVKIFILSTIAILISYAVKNLNAQNHLYATNKFKANSLGSFQAFIEATTDDKIIDQIIQQVSIAVYSQNISGYLSKDEGSTNLSQKDILDFASKTFGKSN